MDARITPAVAHRWTELILDFEAGDRRPAMQSAVYLVVGAVPFQPYGLPDNYDDTDLYEVAECLYAVGYEERGVFEAWPTYDEAAARCRALHTENTSLRVALRVQVVEIGRRCQFAGERPLPAGLERQEPTNAGPRGQVGCDPS
jgi:hypothetical protein